MAFMKYAKAKVTQPYVTPSTWSNIRTASTHGSTIPNNIVDQASEILGEQFSPDRFLLTHATIVASVDTFEPTHVKVGTFNNSGFKVNRKYANFRVAPQCDPFINNNLDCWDREVLLKSYRTFVGGHNFVEHVQIEELSKGRIIDAVARDIGDSIYIDILVATDKKHTELVDSILSGEMDSMSMGCFLPETQVTMGDGTRVSIQDVQVGDYVLTHKGNVKPVKNKQILRGEWNTITLSARGLASDVVSTGNHPYFVYRPQLICACGCGESLASSKDPVRRMNTRFKIGHKARILNPNGTYSLEELRNRQEQLEEINSWKLEEVRADELQVGDYVCFPRVKEDETTNYDVSNSQARLLGYFLAEGSFLKYKGEVVETEFTFSLEEKETFVKEVVSLLKEVYPNAKEPRVYDREDRTTCSVRIYGRDIAEWFKSHGGEYSHKKKLSVEVMNWNLESQKHLIGTWINGDGQLHSIHKTTSAVTTSYDLICQMQALFTRCGFFADMSCRVDTKYSTIQKVVNGGFVRDQETGKRPSFTLTVGKMQTKNLIGFCDKISPSKRNLHLQIQEDYVISPITEVQTGTYEGTVYDLEVEDDHSYVVEGLSVHNCTVDFTQCTKCGHVAVDETEMCKCIKFEKGNIFYDENGQKHRVAELCGHKDVEGGGVTFIEASWVKTPAFIGAKARNILNPSESVSKKAEQILSKPPPEWTDDLLDKVAGGDTKVANEKTSFDFGGGGDESETETPKADSSNFDGLVDDIEKAVTNKVKKKIKKEINKEEEAEKKNPQPSPESSSIGTDDNVHKQAFLEDYKQSVRSLVASSTCSADLINSVAELNNLVGLSIPISIYRIALTLGSISNYSNSTHYIKCGSKMNKEELSQIEGRILVRLGTILSMRNSF